MFPFLLPIMQALGMGGAGAATAGAAAAAPTVGPLAAGVAQSAMLPAINSITPAALGGTLQAAAAPSMGARLAGGLGNALTGQSVMKGLTGNSANDLMARGMGKIGMPGVQNFMQKNPVSLRMNIGNQQSQPTVSLGKNDEFDKLLESKLQDMFKKLQSSRSA